MSDASIMTGHHDGTVLATPRLRLRALRADDIQPLHRKIFGDPAVMAWAFGGQPLSAVESENFIRAHFSFEAGPVGLAVLVDRTGGDLIGVAGLETCTVLSGDDLELGFVLAREVWGRGLATEIGRAQLAYGFERLGRPRLLAMVAPENQASIRTIEKLGMRHQFDVRPDGRSPRRVYSLDAADWHDRSA
jgi:RimJ/RimL family protein N-acetyltransferase